MLRVWLERQNPSVSRVLVWSVPGSNRQYVQSGTAAKSERRDGGELAVDIRKRCLHRECKKDDSGNHRKVQETSPTSFSLRPQGR